MESGSRDPGREDSAETRQEAPPPEAAARADEPPAERRAGALARIGAVLLALVLAFGCAVMVLVMLDIGDSPRCDDQQALLEEQQSTGAVQIECFDGGEVEKIGSLVLGWPGAVLAGLAALLALAFAARGRGGRTLVTVTSVAIVLSGLSILVGSI